MTYSSVSTCSVIVVAAICCSPSEGADELAWARQTADRQRQWTERHIEQASSEQLDHLVLSQDASIACRASWEQLLRRRKGQQTLSETDRVRFGEEFVQVVGQRLQTNPPQWWIDAIRCHLRVSKRTRDVGIFLSSKVEARSASSRPAGVFHLDSGCIVVAAGRQLEIEERHFKSFTAPVAFACILPGGNNTFVAVHAERAIEYPLVCLSTDGTTVNWSARVWAGGGKFDYCGRGFHIAQLLSNANSVIVFGAGDDCVYAESFDKSTGQPMSRFSSGY